MSMSMSRTSSGDEDLSKSFVNFNQRDLSGEMMGVVAGKQMPLLSMATGAFAESAFRDVFDYQNLHVWRVEGFGLVVCFLVCVDV